MDATGREGSLLGPTSQESDGGQAAPLSGAEATQNRSDSSSTSTGSNTGEVPAAVASYALAAANAGAPGTSLSSGSGAGSGSRTPAEPEFVNMNGPLPPIAEHNTHSEMYSETTSSMGDGSRMGGSTAGISPTRPVRPNSGSTLNPNVRPSVSAMGDSVVAESSQLDPASTSVASHDESSALMPPLPAAASGAGAAATAGTAAAAMASTVPADDADERFHTFSVNSLGDSLGADAQEGASDAGQATLHPPSDQMGSVHASLSSDPSAAGASPGVAGGLSVSGSDAATTSSSSPPPATFGAASYPKLTPSATGPGGAAPGESGPLEQNLVSITQLGSIGILADQGSQSNPTEDPAGLPSSQASSSDAVRFATGPPALPCAACFALCRLLCLVPPALLAVCCHAQHAVACCD